MIKFNVYVKTKHSDVIKSQKLEWYFNNIKECLHYAIDNFDRRTDIKMTICKGDKIVMTFENVGVKENDRKRIKK